MTKNYKKKPATSKKNKKQKVKAIDYRDKMYLKKYWCDAKIAKKNKVECQEGKNKFQTPIMKKSEQKNLVSLVLQDISTQLESLPKALQSKMEDLAASILSRVVTIEHMEERIKIMNENPEYSPESTNFEFELTCKNKFKDSLEFSKLAKKVKAL